MGVAITVFLPLFIWIQTAVFAQTWTCDGNCINNTCWSTGLCIYGCVGRYWGSACKNMCPNTCDTDCDQNPLPNSDTPSCGKCPAGSYRNQYNSDCKFTCPSNCKTCRSNTICYECQEGYYIETGSYLCTLRCPEGCKTCLSRTICLNCKEDYYNTDTSKNCPEVCPSQCKSCTSADKCQECNIPYYNEGFVTNCSLHCPVNCMCSSPGLCSACISGYYDTDKKCTEPCPDNCFTCLSSTNCMSCKQGYYSGYRYDDTHTYVDNTCAWSCRDNCTTCTSYNNCTLCKSGHYGQYCQYQCSVGCTASSCDKNSGSCICKDRFYGGLCDLCKPPFHGELCDQNCSEDCKDSKCNKNNGTCVECKSSNFSGSYCAVCVKGLYGSDCNMECSATCKESACDRNNGTCLNGCLTNYDGEKCEKCVEMKHGEYCNMNCPENCHDGICHRNNGSCISCPANFTGNECDQCDTGWYGTKCTLECNSLNCLDKVCDRESGFCKACPDEMYGDFCNKTCSTNCMSAECDIKTGTCDNGCNSNYSGDRCCLEGPNCIICSSNTNCKVCKDEFYGSSCNESCPENCVRCLMLSGNCTECVGNRTWGTDCILPCSTKCVNSTCQQTDGTCSKGCKDGYTGSTCTEAAAATGEPSIVGPAAGGGAAAAVVLIIVGVMVILFIRRRNNPGAGKLSMSTICSGKRTNDDTFTPVPSGTSSTGSSSSINKGNVAVPLESPLEDDMANEEEDDNNPKQDTYYNMSTKVKVSGLFDYVNKKSLNSYKDEFKHLPSDLRKPYNDARKPENQVKNRYTGIYPYDASRVRIKGDSRFFINACYIDGYKKERAYIASLGPTKKATEDFRTFWKMIWHEKSDTIVMLTNLQEPSGMKCEKYWPDQGVTETYGDVVVKCLGEEEFAEYSVRTLNLTHRSLQNKDTRSLTQFHYTAWPDKSVPDNVVSLVEFWQRVRGNSTAGEGPPVVHCSAGIGRTGTYIALDRLTKEGMAEGSVNIYGCVLDMREQRVNMVQTQDQYIYLHKALAYTLTFDCQAISKDAFRQYTTKAKNALINRQFRELQSEIEDEKDAEREARVRNAAYRDLNRKGADIPGDTGRARLYLNKSSEYSNVDYINAVYVDSFTRRNHFVIAQTPLPSTLEDFVCLLFQDNFSCAISLDSNTTDGKDIGMYLPPDNQTLTCGPFSLTSSRVESTSTYTARKLTIKYSAQQKTVLHFQYTGWKKEASVPDSAEDFVQFIKGVNRKSEPEASEDHRPVLVHCLNGAERSGLFCVVFDLLEKVQAAGQASIFNTVRQIKARRKTAIPHKEQLLFCYQCVAAYIDLYSTYYNFEM